ncbi:MAG: hypothetical protein ACI8RZ_002108 [Myxococcota bacterium]|jgi:hypothetical protein
MLISLLLASAVAAPPADLSTFWTPWFESPYEPMMTANPGWKNVPPGARSSSVILGAGIDGFFRYGGMIDCVQRLLGTAATGLNSDQMMEALAGVPMHTGHIGEGYQRGFQTYSPAMIDWAANNLIPPPEMTYRDGTFRDAYEQTFFRAVRLHALAYRALTTTHDLDTEAAAYKVAMTTEPDFDGIMWLGGRYSGVLSAVYPLYADDTMLTPPTAMGFWLRRHLDGTAPLLSKHLDTLLRQYDPTFCAQIERGVDGCLL